tara:strand:- start:286 stop:1314 length:1029 start_codon:yes stop_codon:yes gene_type:complete
MVEIKNKFAIGCLIQWYEIEMVGEYLQSVKNSIKNIDNKENIIVDLYFNCDQTLEKVDESQMSMVEVREKFDKLLFDIFDYEDNDEVGVVSNTYNLTIKFNMRNNIYTIADYRREFNENYCDKVDVLMWGESDALIPRQTFEILDNMHTQVKDERPKYITFFGMCKMWDDSWKVLEHPDFTDKPFYDSPDDFDPKEHWWSLRYSMNIDEMNNFNDKVEELDVKLLNQHKFNGCGLVISSEVIKSGVNIPRSVFFVHEDTAFMFMIQKVLGMIPQFVIKNILLVHNRNNPKKRMYVAGESGKTVNLRRRSNDWYVKANKLSEQNCYNITNPNHKSHTWEDVWK